LKTPTVSFYLDEDLNEIVAPMLRSVGIIVVTTTEEKRKASPDPEQLKFAVQRRHIIVTHNRDHYQELAKEYFELGEQHFGIVIAKRRFPGQIADRLIELAEQFSADEMVNQVIYI